MLVLDLSQRLQQNLLTHFLLNQGYRIENWDATHSIDWASTILLTDKQPLQSSVRPFKYQIWLLDVHGSISNDVPAQVKGLLVSDCELTELETCVQQVLLNKSYISPGLLSLLTRHAERGTNESTLTPREQEILGLIKGGNSLRTIADKLFISEHTAENHRANIQKKLALTGRLSLVRYAAQAALEGK